MNKTEISTFIKLILDIVLEKTNTTDDRFNDVQKCSTTTNIKQYKNINLSKSHYTFGGHLR